MQNICILLHVSCLFTVYAIKNRAECKPCLCPVFSLSQILFGCGINGDILFVIFNHRQYLMMRSVTLTLFIHSFTRDFLCNGALLPANQRCACWEEWLREGLRVLHMPGWFVSHRARSGHM